MSQLQIPDRYRLTKFGPSGGQASIHYAHDTWLDREVVIKTSRTGVGYDAAKEVKSLAAINSKHVVSIYDTIKSATGEILAIVEEAVPGDTLSSRFSGTLQFKAKLHLLYQIACGVSDMHKVGRVHRDLKPSNMNVRPDGLLKIFDFGITTVLQDGDTTQIGKGTRGYKAPELNLAGPKKVAPSVDLYSIGVIAHQLLSNRALHPAFSAKPTDPLAAGVNFDTLITQGKRLRNLLNKCLSITPGDRPSIDEVRDALLAEVLRDQHEARIVAKSQTFILNSQTKAVRIDDSGNVIVIRYTGTRFKILSHSGDVFVNNIRVADNQVLNGAVVITLGGSGSGSGRFFATFDISNPEVTV